MKNQTSNNQNNMLPESDATLDKLRAERNAREIAEMQNKRGFAVKVSTVICSHLNEMEYFLSSQTRMQSVNFIKFLIIKYQNTNTEINPDVEWANFKTEYPNFFAVNS